MRNKIWAIVLFVLLTFFPIINLSGISIPTILFLFPILFLIKPVFDKKLMVLSLIATAVLSAIHIPVLAISGNLTPKGAFYALYPLIIYFTYSIAVSIIRGTDKKIIAILLKSFIVIQLLFCIIQLTNIFNTRVLLEGLFLRWQSVNALKTTGVLEVAYRPFGTIGNPVYLAIVVFLFGKNIRLINKKQYWYFLTIAIIMLTGARLAIAMVIVFLIADYVIKMFVRHPIKSVIAVIMMAIAGYFAVNYVPFIKILFERYVVAGGSISNDYSITYRMSMIDMMKDNLNIIIFGGYGIENFPAYVDNEIVLRTMQLGVVGFLIIIGCYKGIYNNMKNGVKSDEGDMRQQAIFLLGCTISSVVFTNPLIMQYVLVSAAINKEKLLKEK